MKPAPFRYERPRSISEVLALLASEPTGTRLLAGGQSLVPLLSRRIERPSLIIDINRMEGLDRIELLPAWVQMGALVRQQQGWRSTLVRTQAPAVAQALGWVANPVVRARGTVIGNLVVNGAGAELPAVALALGAEFLVQDAAGERQLSAAELLGPGGSLPRDAFVTHVRWPRRPARTGFCEVARRHGHAPVVSAMVSLAATDCRVAVSGVCARGLSCRTVAQLIKQSYPLEPDATELAEALRADLDGPAFEDAYSSSGYRLDVAPVVIQRALRMILPPAGVA